MSRAEYAQKFGTELKEQRQKLRITRREVARAAGVTVGAVGMWESGGSIPSAYSRDRLNVFFKQQWIARQAQAAAEVAVAEGARP